jgi:hypothetical protein
LKILKAETGFNSTEIDLLGEMQAELMWRKLYQLHEITDTTSFLLTDEPGIVMLSKMKQMFPSYPVSVLQTEE